MTTPAKTFVFYLANALCSLALISAAHAGKNVDLQTEVESLAPTVTNAALPIVATSNLLDPNSPKLFVAIGTGFLIDREGHFITAAHVVDTKQVGGVNVTLNAIVRQVDDSGMAQPFEVIEKDADHDLALCGVRNFKVFPWGKSPTSGQVPQRTLHPFASLEIATTPTHTGRFVLLSGFPLGSLTPAVQFGMISATKVIYGMGTVPVGVPKDTHELLQVSVSGNHGNSGGPVIDVQTGQVVGVLLQLVPAPLSLGGKTYYDSGTFTMSGIMLAAPARWVNDLLSKHNIHSEGVRSGRFEIW